MSQPDLKDEALAEAFAGADPILKAVRERFRVHTNPERNKVRRFMRTTQRGDVASTTLSSSAVEASGCSWAAFTRVPKDTGQHPKFKVDKRKRNAGESTGSHCVPAHPFRFRIENDDPRRDELLAMKEDEVIRNLSPKKFRERDKSALKFATISSGLSKILLFLNSCAPTADQTAESSKPESMPVTSSDAASAWHRFAQSRSSRVSLRRQGFDFRALYRALSAAKRNSTTTPSADSPL